MVHCIHFYYHSICEIQCCFPCEFVTEKDRESMLKDADLAAARSTIAQLKAEILTLKTSNKRARIEFEQDLGCVKEEKYVCIEENMIKIMSNLITSQYNLK